jgi:hypothetical protein
MDGFGSRAMVILQRVRHKGRGQGETLVPNHRHFAGSNTTFDQSTLSADDS